ncbi:MAG: PH domain-containing protein [Candidatus Magasanikbacteria bacterium]|nr:PH domain-containing protein [Candidatus Magasanikbacteria bacterium]
MGIEKQIKLKDREKIITVVSRYGPTFFWSWILIFVLFVTPFFFMFWLFNHGWWGQVLFFLPVAIGIFVFIRTIFIWKKNVLIITTDRIVDIDQRGFFDKEVSDVPYSQIEDVSGRIKGFFGTIFRYGSLQIQTGNGKVQIVIDKIKQPVYLQQEINELRERLLRKY